MQRVTINVTHATQFELIETCRSLGFAATPKTPIQEMRTFLRKYRQRYQEWRRWCELAQMLTGQEVQEYITTPEDAEQFVGDFLYAQLEQAGYAAANGTGEPFHDHRNHRKVTVLARTSAMVVRVALPQPGTHDFSLLYVVRCTLPEIARILDRWQP